MSDLTNNRSALSRWQWVAISTIVVSLLGSAFHFIYRFSKNSEWTKWFAAKNESIWEHMKLLVFPHLIMSIIIGMVGTKDATFENDIIIARSIGLIVALAFIPLVFYSYTGGQPNKSILAVDITLFIVAAFISNVFMGLLVSKKKWTQPISLISWATLIIIPILFVVFSYWSPTNKGLFDPNIDTTSDTTTLSLTKQ
jgi:hypothetical protein